MSDLAKLGANMVESFSFIGKTIGAPIGVVLSTIKDMLVGILEVLGGIGKAIVGAFTFNWDTVKSGLSDISGAFSGTWKNLGETGKAYFDTIGDSFNDMISGMKRNNGELEQTTTSAVKQVADAIPKITSVAQKASGAIENITESLRKLLGEAKSARDETQALADPITHRGRAQSIESNRDIWEISRLGLVGEEEALSRVKERLSEIADRVREIKQAGDPRAYAEEIAWIEERTSQMKGAMREVVAPRLEMSGAEEDIQNLMKGVDDATQSITETKRVSVEISEAQSAVNTIKQAIDDIPSTKTLELDASSAINDAHAVRSAIDAIPNVTTKTVIVEYKTKASPVRPFSEGMDYIESRMKGLPQESEHIVRYGMAGANNPSGAGYSSASQAAPVSSPTSGGAITFAPSITVNAAPGQNAEQFARDIERILAERWRTNRSQLRQVMAT